jgi:hypothetical protein
VVNIGQTAEDTSRLALTESIVTRGTLTIDERAGETIDKAHYGRHWYTDKAPGVSFAAVPAYAVLEGVRTATGSQAKPLDRRSHLWLTRVFSVGVLYLLGAFVLGRVAEGLVPGAGAAVAVTFAIGTEAGSLAATIYGHTAGGVLSLAGFLLVWSASGGRVHKRRYLAAGLCAGLAVVFEYPTALIAVLTLAYALARAGPRRAVLVALGGAPPLAVLGLYNVAAFGSPFHLSYRYVAEDFRAQQERGFFGIGLPSWDGVRDVLWSQYGLLVLSPVCALAAVGLWLMFRRGFRLEALFCSTVVTAFLLLNVGYWDRPYGGGPGPRFLASALPFLALGLPFAFGRWPRLTGLVAAISVVLTLWNALTWAFNSPAWPFEHALSLENPPSTVWSGLGLPALAAFGLVYATGIAAVVIALGRPELARRRAPEPVAPQGRLAP